MSCIVISHRCKIVALLFLTLFFLVACGEAVKTATD